MGVAAIGAMVDSISNIALHMDLRGILAWFSAKEGGTTFCLF